MTKQVKTEEILLPSKDETAAVTSKVKTAALCYDRVWCPPENVFGWEEEFPERIRFFGGTEVERTISFDISDKSIKTFPSMRKLFESEEGLDLMEKSTLGLMAGLMSAGSKEEFAQRLDRAGKVPLAQRERYLDNANVIMDLIYRDIARAFSRKYKTPVATICESEANRRVAYSGGDREAVVACLVGLAMVDESQLTWEQVLKFREDKDNRRKYKRFLHWLDKEMVGRSQAFIEDEISLRLQDYENALKKHGIKTVIGEVSEVLAGGGLVAALSDPKHGVLTAGALTIGKLAIKVAKILLDYDDVERGANSEISWVYEVKKLRK